MSYKFINTNDTYCIFDKQTMLLLNDRGSVKENIEIYQNIYVKNLQNFTAELQFLVYYIELSNCSTVIYTNTEACYLHSLIYLFPDIEFHIYSENIIQEDYRFYKNVYSYYKKFDNNDIEFWSAREINYALITNQGIDQKNIIEKLRPYAALADFCPAEEDHYNFLYGQILRPAFSQIDYNSKIIIRGVSYKSWDINKYKQSMNYHHLYLRKCKNFMNPITMDNSTIYREKGLYNGYDETVLTITIMDYLTKINQKINYKNVICLVIYLLDNINKQKKINLDLERIIS